MERSSADKQYWQKHPNQTVAQWRTATNSIQILRLWNHQKTWKTWKTIKSPRVQLRALGFRWHLHPLQPDLTNISEHAAPYLTAETGKIKTQEYIGGQPLFGTFDAPEVLSVSWIPLYRSYTSNIPQLSYSGKNSSWQAKTTFNLNGLTA